MQFWDEFLNDNLRDQLIEKLTDFELKRKLLEQRNITLEEALDKARAWEAAARKASNMKTSPPLADGNSVNVVKERQQTTNDDRRKCYNCGREGHLARDIGTVLHKERSVESVEGMDILLCVVVPRGIVMWLGEKRASNKGFLVDDHVT